MKHKFGQFSGSIFAALTLTMSVGCSNVSQDTISSSSVSNDVTTASSELPSVFTTVGKPTKTIETPWGPREVYDPLQDEVVRASFEYIYNQNNPDFRIIYNSNDPRFKIASSNKDSSFGFHATLVNDAMTKQIDVYENLSCSFLITSLCSTWFADHECKAGFPCDYLFYEAGGKFACSVGENHAYDISHLRLGEWSKLNSPNINLDEQLKNLFLVHCKSYGE